MEVGEFELQNQKKADQDCLRDLMLKQGRCDAIYEDSEEGERIKFQVGAELNFGQVLPLISYMEYLVHLLFLLKLIAFLFDSFKIVIFIFC